jgi:hypothetical protein
VSHTPGGASPGLPGTYHTAYAIAASDRQLYALRNDGAVFILFKRGDMAPDGKVCHAPHWAHVPAVPGTIAALEQASEAPVAAAVASSSRGDVPLAPGWWRVLADAIAAAVKPAQLEPDAIQRAARRVAAELEIAGLEIRRFGAGG